jgi:NADPH:quinone reductase-like Zn-dependent oxidoreductase
LTALATRALWFQRAHAAALVDEPMAAGREGFSVVRSEFSAISPGTERLVFAGEVPEPMRTGMRVPYMGGDFGFPLKYGYSLVGRVESSAAAALRGRRVHLMHPHQDCVMARDEDLFVVPEGVPAARATLAANLETAVNAVWDAQVPAGAACLVVGFGIVGSLIARLLSRMPGTAVTVCDRDATKCALAATLGFCACAPEAVQHGFDVAFHASASGEGLQLCIDATGFEATIVEASWYGTRAVTLQLGGSFHNQRKRIVSTQVSSIAAPMRERWSFARRKALAFELLRDAAFDAHITESVAFAQLPAWFNSGGLDRPGLARVVDYRSGAASCSS